ncbi:hypothetical protein [Natrialbaceae archaeon AArc-T1-2]|uniref:hypothetical protein n=1 Tax=Natrialbaceae archaeon AArc-T1-2 TaxID=3053904 RepID=UPI00255ACA24|nr:hypothetical protein [Natrialbaceae archaeon AArc-T1-2]WIV67174.1 hypothetical protein QQ977_00145 [Natrialbaceae archaeon AArc-T1-2]
MKWRCAWCGKPHEENDPPCDTCGHNSFEEAVVRERQLETVDTGPEYVWRCPSCGRDHVKNTPPCSRCGNPELEQTEQTYEDVERDLETPSWFEVAKPYTPVIAVLVLVVGLFATGIVPLSILPGVGTPTPPDAPGDGETAAGLDLEETEGEIHDRLEAERESEGYESRTTDAGLGALAEYLNRQYVVAEYTDDDPGETPPPSEFDPSCTGEEIVSGSVVLEDTVDDYNDETALADDVADALLEADADVRSGYEAEEIDVHVVEGDVVVRYAAC